MKKSTLFHVYIKISPEKFIPHENGDKSDEEMVEEVIEVPHEVEVEEIREREVMQDVVETRKIPQVKAMYTYKGQGMKVEKGEVSVICVRCSKNVLSGFTYKHMHILNCDYSNFYEISIAVMLWFFFLTTG